MSYRHPRWYEYGSNYSKASDTVFCLRVLFFFLLALALVLLISI